MFELCQHAREMEVYSILYIALDSLLHKSHVGFETVMIVTGKNVIFWDVMTLKMHASCSSETSVKFYQTMWCHIPQDSTLPHKCFIIVSTVILACDSLLFQWCKMCNFYCLDNMNRSFIFFLIFYPDLIAAENSHADHIEYLPTNEPQVEAWGINWVNGWDFRWQPRFLTFSVAAFLHNPLWAMLASPQCVSLAKVMT
jgi:hypothetical protein